jgi:hypothetical protein
VVLRNSIDRHYKTIKGNDWREDAVAPGGYLDTGIGCEDSFHAVHEAIQNLGSLYTHDRLIAKLTFGFWRYQIAKKEFAAAGSSLLAIFPNRPFGVNHKQVFQELTKINEVRNRIAHHEPICFQDEAISTVRIINRHNLILEVFHWLGCNNGRILYGVDGVMKTIGKINGIISEI